MQESHEHEDENDKELFDDALFKADDLLNRLIESRSFALFNEKTTFNFDEESGKELALFLQAFHKSMVEYYLNLYK